jgi:hypothetical protein
MGAKGGPPVPVHDMTKAASSIIGKPAMGSHARCSDCGYGTVLDSCGAAIIVHAANCPGRCSDPYVACDNRDCRRVLDPARVASNGAKTCDDRCRAAAWKQRTGYGRNTVPSESRSHGYTGAICDGCGGDVSQSGDVHSEGCPVFSAQLARAIEVADEATARRRRKPSGVQVSYRKAVEALAGALMRHGEANDISEAREAAVIVLRPALSERQRKQLEDRESERGSA